MPEISSFPQTLFNEFFCYFPAFKFTSGRNIFSKNIRVSRIFIEKRTRFLKLIWREFTRGKLTGGTHQGELAGGILRTPFKASVQYVLWLPLSKITRQLSKYFSSAFKTFIKPFWRRIDCAFE